MATYRTTIEGVNNGATFAYDANGNMTQRIEGGVVYTQVWDVDNRLVQVDCATNPIRLYYGPDGDMVRKDTPRGSTFYVSADYEIFHGTTSTNTTVYYAFNGGRAAMRTGGAVYWLHSDHLGSYSLSTDQAGASVSEVRYLPFGETRWYTGTAPTNRLYTGQRSLMGVGLYDYNARMYSPSLGRFISADTIVPRAADPQMLNRYAYARNNPLKYADPTGHTTECGTVCGWSYPGGSFGSSGYSAGGAGSGSLRAGTAGQVATSVSVGLVVGAGAAQIANQVNSQQEADRSSSQSSTSSGSNGSEPNGSSGIGEAIAKTIALGKAWGELSKAADYGVKAYKTLQSELENIGLQAHHIIEARFASIINVAKKEMPSVAVTPEEHQAFTNAWRQIIDYSNSKNPTNTVTASVDDLMRAVQRIYAKYPALLDEAIKHLSKQE